MSSHLRAGRSIRNSTRHGLANSGAHCCTDVDVSGPGERLSHASTDSEDEDRRQQSVSVTVILVQRRSCANGAPDATESGAENVEPVLL
jgi:hypothetical protein